MSLITQAFIFDKYGPRLTADQVAELLGVRKPTLLNMRSNGTCPIKMYQEQGKIWADYRDAAAYFDECRTRAK